MRARLFHRALIVASAVTVWRYLSQVLFRPGSRGDLDILLLAGERFLRHEPIYRLADSSEHTKPPLLTPLLLPLTWIPRDWAHTLSDLTLLALPGVIFWLWQRYREKTLSSTTGMLGFLLLSPLWLVEAQYGQYNLLQLALLLGALLLCRPERGLMEKGLSGGLFTATLLLKPTVIFFAPWFLRLQTADRDGTRVRIRTTVLPFIAGSLATLLLLGAVSVALSSFTHVLEDLRTWKGFIAVSQARHLVRDDNFGIPTLLARLGWDPSRGLLLLLAPLFLSLAVCMQAKERRMGWLWIHTASLTFSPMCWRQNFVVFLPLAWELIEMFRENPRRQKNLAIAGLLALFLVGRVSDYWVSRDLQKVWNFWAIPSLLTWLALFALTLARSKGEARPGLTSREPARA